MTIMFAVRWVSPHTRNCRIGKYEKEDFLENSRILSCFVQLKSVPFNLLCVFVQLAQIFVCVFLFLPLKLYGCRFHAIVTSWLQSLWARSLEQPLGKLRNFHSVNVSRRTLATLHASRWPLPLSQRIDPDIFFLRSTGYNLVSETPPPYGMACLICLTCRLFHIPFTETICWHLRFLKSNTVGQFHGQLAGFTRIGPITYNRVSPLSLLHAWRQSPARSTNWTRKLCLSVSLISWANIVCMFFLPFPVSV